MSFKALKRILAVMAHNPSISVLPELPDELLIEIFSRLPAKSVGKCRCLSKPWRAQLSTPSFIKSHLTRQTHQQNLILMSPSNDLHTISIFKDGDETVSKKLNLSNTWSAVVSSCDGPVLLANEEGDPFLVNPITQERVKVPDPPLASFTTRMHGFGYDPVNDDYKIVTLSDYYAFMVRDTFLDVYSVKLGVWRRLDSPSSYNHSIPFGGYGGAFVNGAIHSFAISREPGYPFVITAFDLGREEFYEIPAPIDAKKNRFNRLFVLEGCLCMLDTSSSVVIDLWMLKEYNKEESWTKFRVYNHDEWKPLCFVGDDEVVLVAEGDTSVSEEYVLVVYNFKDQGFTNMVVDGVSAVVTSGETFIESLLSPAFGNETRGNISK